jgi:hypothetical protein
MTGSFVSLPSERNVKLDKCMEPVLAVIWEVDCVSGFL